MVTMILSGLVGVVDWAIANPVTAWLSLLVAYLLAQAIYDRHQLRGIIWQLGIIQDAVRTNYQDGSRHGEQLERHAEKLRSLDS